MSTGDILTLLGTGGGWTLALVFLALFVTGQIVPKSRIEESRADLEEMREERNEWKKIAELERQRADVERQRGDAGILAGQMAKDIVASLRKEITSLCGHSGGSGWSVMSAHW